MIGVIVGTVLITLGSVFLISLSLREYGECEDIPEGDIEGAIIVSFALIFIGLAIALS